MNYNQIDTKTKIIIRIPLTPKLVQYHSNCIKMSLVELFEVNQTTLATSVSGLTTEQLAYVK